MLTAQLAFSALSNQESSVLLTFRLSLLTSIKVINPGNLASEGNNIYMYIYTYNLYIYTYILYVYIHIILNIYIKTTRCRLGQHPSSN